MSKRTSASVEIHGDGIGRERMIGKRTGEAKPP